MPERITLSRAKGWRMPENTVKVDRRSIFGNPYQAGNPSLWWWPRGDGLTGWEIVHQRSERPMTIDQACAYFSAWLYDQNALPNMPESLSEHGRLKLFEAMTDRRANILDRLPSLRGKNLACWCKPGQPCHADVLLELANA